MQHSGRKRLIIPLTIAIVASLGLVGAAVAFVRAGIYNVGADDPHMPATYAVLEQLREASIQARASKLEIPKDLMSQARITQGAGNYAAMCTQCHLAPGMTPTEISRGLYPAPPDLTKDVVDAAAAFWVIKHGLKASGMPAWGSSMGDEYIWNMAAFIQKLPTLDAAQYRALLASSGGHSHGGGETMPNGDAGEQAGMKMPVAGGHAHAPGTTLHDNAPATTPAGGHEHAPGTPAHDDTPAKPAKPAHIDPPGASPHTH